METDIHAWRSLLDYDAHPYGYVLMFILLAAGLFIGRRAYLYYLQKRLFFDPWTNLSGKSELNFGASLSEMLLFELANIQNIHQRSYQAGSLYNEKADLPFLQQGQNGQPGFLSQVELLGFKGKIGIVLRILRLVVFWARPATLHGSIHKYGDRIRLQVSLEGRRDDRRHVMPSMCWKKECLIDKIEDLPLMISDLAYTIYLELSGSNCSKSPESFRHFTQALNHHLDYNTIKDETALKGAIEEYTAAISTDGNRNAAAAYNIGLLLYAKYDARSNDEALEHFKSALQTSDNLLRAHAYRGMANALCQKYQRHGSGDEFTLKDALRLASYAYKIPEASNNAEIVKSLAYAWHVQENNATCKEEEVEMYRRKAIRFYKKAITLNKKKYTIAQNNLGYLYLEWAKEWRRKRKEPVAQVVQFLQYARSYCEQAKESDPTYFHAYDNLGNIVLEEEELTQAKLEHAEGCYLQALDLNPNYLAAMVDLSWLYLRFADIQPVESPDLPYFIHRACAYHARAIQMITADNGDVQPVCDAFVTKALHFGFKNFKPYLSGKTRKPIDQLPCTCSGKLMGNGTQAPADRPSTP